MLLLSVAGMGACLVRSWWLLSPAGSSVEVQLFSGCLWMNNIRAAVAPDGTRGTEVIGMDDPHWLWPGETGFVEASDGLWGAVLPLWIPAAVSGGVLLALARSHLRERRRAMVGCCTKCGYDLAGIDGVCPECGRRL